MAQSPLCEFYVMNDFLKWIGRALLGPIGGIAGSGAFLLNRLDGGNRSNALDDVWSGISNLLGLKKPLQEQVDSYTNTLTQAGPTGRDLWVAEREDTLNQRTVRDMTAAGLNPALLYGSGGYQPSINTSSSGQSSGISDLLQLALLPLQMQSAKADINLKESEANRNNADVNRINAESEGLQLSNNWIDRLNKAKEDSIRMSIELDDNRKWQIRQDIAESRVRCTKAVAEVIEVETRTELEFSQMALNQATAKRIVELLPYEKLLKSAQTDAERASAEANFARAAYENGLITNGMIEFECRKANAESDFAAVRAQIANPDFEPSNSKADVVCRNIVAGLKRTFMMLSAK